MAKRTKVAEVVETDPSVPDHSSSRGTQADKPDDLVKVEVLTNEAIIMGHELKAGTVIELSVSDIDVHRDHGVCLGTVGDDDPREVFDVHTPPEPIDDSENAPEAA